MTASQPSQRPTHTLAADVIPAEAERLAGALALRVAECAAAEPDLTQRAEHLAQVLHGELGAAQVMFFTRRATPRSARCRAGTDRLIVTASCPARRNSYESVLRAAAHRALEERRLVETHASAATDATAPGGPRIAALPFGAPEAACVLALCWEGGDRHAETWPLPVLIRLAPMLTLATQPLGVSLAAHTPARMPIPAASSSSTRPAKTATAPARSADLLALMSHELRTPLNTINGFLEILLDGLAGSLSERQREFLAYAHTSTRHLTQLLDEMLLLSRPDAGRGLLYRVRTDPRGAIEAARAAQAEAAQARDVRIACDIAADLPALSADEARLTQALGYLLGWALERTPSGGAVSLRASPSAAGITLAIEDTGPALDPAALEPLFEPVRPQPGAAPAAATGLELAVAHRIFALHGGALHASNRSEGGVRLLCTLAADKLTGPARPGARGPRPAGLGGKGPVP
jgi:signal transduction histidine kinase